MSQRGTSKLLIRDVEPRLKGRIARKVEDAGSNMNDIAVGILSDYYETDFEPSGVRRDVGDSSTVMLYMPQELRDAIELDAAASGDSMRNVVVKIISNHLRVKYVPTGRWPAARRTRAAA